MTIRGFALAVLAAMTPLAGIQAKPVPVAASPTGAFTLDPLPYPADHLAPVIDAQTMTLHHGKHHRAQVDALNRAISENPALQGKSLEQLLAGAGTYPAAVRNNAGGHWNHSFFWTSMTAPNTSAQPSPKLLATITKQYGSLDAMKAAFKQAGSSRFGSGWVWLIVKPDGTLAITSTPNQDNPLMDVAEVKGTPILGNDVWEHAYYLTYQNRRGDYLHAWWQVVNWAKVSDRFSRATGGATSLPIRP